MTELRRVASDLVKAMQCGESKITILPSLVYVGCVGVLLYQLMSSNRPAVFRRLAREIIIQEVVFMWLMSQAIRIWIWVLYIMDSILDLYWQQMASWFPCKRFLAYPETCPDIAWLPYVIQLLLQPSTLKITLSSILAVSPLALLSEIRRNSPLAHFMIWMGPQRWDTTELGSAAYYLERPFVLGNESAREGLTLSHSRASTGSIPRNSTPTRLRTSMSI